MKVRSIFVLTMMLLLIAAPAMATPPSCPNANAIINPGNQNVYESTVVTLNGTNSNPKDNVTCKWTSLTDPAVVITNPNSCTATFTAPEVGPNGASFDFQLVVTETVSGCTGVTDSKTTTINVANVVATNLPPVASATVSPSPYALEGELVTLDGSGSYDPDGNVLTYIWEQLSGTTVTLNSSGAIATFTAPNDAYPNGEALTFKLTVSDGSLSSSTEKIVNITWVNDPPQASVVCPASVNERAPVTLDGKGSNDIDDGIDTFAWIQTLGTPNADLTGVDLNGNTLTFTAPTLTSELDTMTFRLAVTDVGGLQDSAECSIKVLDITPPSIQCDVPDQTIWHGDNVTVNCTASDIASGLADTNDASFALTTSVPGDIETDSASTNSKTVTDKRENAATAGPYSFKIDKKAPTVDCGTADTSWHATDQSVTCTATDGGSGPATQTVSLATNVTAGTETSDASADSQPVCDLVDNCATAGPVTGFKIDKKAPTDITFIGSIEDGDSYYFGYVPSVPTCTATDSGSGFDTCVVTGYSTSVGSHTLTATAKDKVGNGSTSTLSCTVLAWTLKGFYQPVDMPGQTIVYNTVKNGSTVPLKFEIFAGSTELTDTSSVKSLTYAPTACDANATTDEVETMATGGTVLRYDTTGGQFIYNWKTPSTAGKCYRVTMMAQDGSSLIAYFKLK